MSSKVSSSEYGKLKTEQLRKRVAEKDADAKLKRRPNAQWAERKKEDLKPQRRSREEWIAKKLRDLQIKQNPKLAFTETEEPARVAPRNVIDFSAYFENKKQQDAKDAKDEKKEAHKKEPTAAPKEDKEVHKTEEKDDGHETTEREEIDLNKINPILDYTHRLPNGCKIRVLGIRHGAPGIPKPRITDLYLKHALAAHKGEVLIEGPSDSNPHAIPTEYTGKAIAIEPIEIHDVVLKGGVKAFASWRVAKLLLDKWMGKRPKLEEGEVKLFTRPVSPAQEDKFVQDMKKGIKQMHKKYGSRKVTQASLDDGLNFVINTRSALMAASVLARADKDKSHKAVIMGFAHASQVCRFLAKPEIGARYLKSIRYNFEFRKYHGKDAILRHIDDSIKAFEKQARQNKQPAKQTTPTHH